MLVNVTSLFRKKSHLSNSSNKTIPVPAAVPTHTSLLLLNALLPCLIGCSTILIGCSKNVLQMRIFFYGTEIINTRLWFWSAGFLVSKYLVHCAVENGLKQIIANIRCFTQKNALVSLGILVLSINTLLVFLSLSSGAVLFSTSNTGLDASQPSSGSVDVQLHELHAYRIEHCISLSF